MLDISFVLHIARGFFLNKSKNKEFDVNDVKAINFSIILGLGFKNLAQ